MSKDTVEFPWRNPFEEDDSKPLSPIPPAPSGYQPPWQSWMQSHKGRVLLIVAIAILIFGLAQNKPPATSVLPSPQDAQLSIMVPILPFAKGSVIEPQMLKPVIAPIKSFTKGQLLSVFTEEDIERVAGGRIVAKKDLPPYRPIFWPSLELKKMTTSAPPAFRLLYPQDQGESP